MPGQRLVIDLDARRLSEIARQGRGLAPTQRTPSLAACSGLPPPERRFVIRLFRSGRLAQLA